MLCRIGTTDSPFSVSEYYTLGGISSYDLRATMPFDIRPFSAEASTALVMLPISRRS